MNYSHGETVGRKNTPEYRAWCGMIERCERADGPKFPRYGGRGISVCRRWRRSFPAFLKDIGRRPSPKHSIERKKVDGNYDAKNVKWATAKVQQRNRSNNRIVTFQGRKMSLAEAVEKAGMVYDVVKQRLRLGWSEDDALTLPVERGKHLKKRTNR